MSQEKSENEIDGISKLEKSTYEYLQDNPDFLVRYPELLVNLRVPDENRGRALSLIERQVEVLRNREQDNERRLGELISTAQENEALSEKLQAFSLRLIAAGDLEDLVTGHLSWFLHGEQIRDVAVLVSVPIMHPPLQVTQEDDSNTLYQDIRQRIAHGNSVCEDRLPKKLLRYLFGSHDAILSCALIPLGLPDTGAIGLMALGAGDHDRFHPDMGTHHLDRLGQLMSAALQRCR